MFDNRMTLQSKRWALAGLLVGSIAVSGCASRGGILGVDCCADIPAGAVPAPAGTNVCDWQTAHVSSALTDQTLLYQADFVGKSSTLSPGAIARIARQASNGLAAMQPSLIEPSGDVSLDAQRVDAVNVQLATFGITSPQVQIATPAALGLRGPQAERVASGFGNMRNSSSGTGAPLSQASGVSRQGGLGGTF